MKKSIALLLAMLMVLGLAACGSAEQSALTQDTFPNATEPEDTEPEHTHVYVETVTAPTCIAKGYTTYTCTCGYSYVGCRTWETDHTWGDWKTVKEPTETAEGTSERSCSTCAKTETKKLDKVHVHQYTQKVTAPTCTKKGYTTYTCSCGNSYKGNEVSATGHSYQNDVCKNCGTRDPNVPSDVEKLTDIFNNIDKAGQKIEQAKSYSSSEYYNSTTLSLIKSAADYVGEAQKIANTMKSISVSLTEDYDTLQAWIDGTYSSLNALYNEYKNDPGTDIFFQLSLQGDVLVACQNLTALELEVYVMLCAIT